MSGEEARYTRELRRALRDSGLSEPEFRRVYMSCVSRGGRRRGWEWWVWAGAGAALWSWWCWRGWARALQSWLHPGLRALRRAALPLLALLPRLAELHDETCLIPNPLFHIVDMECWPCSDIRHVIHTREPEKMLEEAYGVPFIYKTTQKALNLSILQQMYNDNKAVFDRDASKVIINDQHSITAEEMFEDFSKDGTRQNHNFFVWRTNRISPAQIIRKNIPRPKIVPRFGQSTERYLIIDLGSKTFRLPDPECHFTFLLQVKGNRIVELRPAEECINHCRAVSVLLNESHLLWYNWWYWRPVLQPSRVNETSILHIGSYC